MAMIRQAVRRVELTGARRIGILNARPVQGCPQLVARNQPYDAVKLRSRVAGPENLAARLQSLCCEPWWCRFRFGGDTVEFYAYPADTHFPHDIVRSTDVYRRWVLWMTQHRK